MTYDVGVAQSGRRRHGGGEMTALAAVGGPWKTPISVWQICHRGIQMSQVFKGDHRSLLHQIFPRLNEVRRNLGHLVRNVPSSEVPE